MADPWPPSDILLNTTWRGLAAPMRDLPIRWGAGNLLEKEDGGDPCYIAHTLTLEPLPCPNGRDARDTCTALTHGVLPWPKGNEDYLEPVMALCRAAVRLTGEDITEAHMTVDEKVIQAGWSQRRPGAHVDGCYLPDQGGWGGHPVPGWAHYCNNLPMPRISIIVAASEPGCIAYDGIFKGEPASDGDLEHIRDQLGKGHLLPANRGYLLSPDCVHESMIFDTPTKRTFLRVAFHLGRETT